MGARKVALRAAELRMLLKPPFRRVLLCHWNDTLLFAAGLTVTVRFTVPRRLTVWLTVVFRLGAVMFGRTAAIGVARTEEDATPLPAALTARTRNEASVLLVKPVKVWLRALADTLTHAPPLRDTSYRVMGEPPVAAGDPQETVTLRLPGTAWTLRGAPGMVRGVALCDT